MDAEDRKPVTKNARPFLVDRRCDCCLVPFEISERREDGWVFVTYRCDRCGFNQVVTFSPAELTEWTRRSERREARA